MKIYTVGYMGWKLDELVERIKSLGDDLRVYDVRHSPYSRNRDFAQASLVGELGSSYIHAKGFGNVNYRGGAIKLANPEPWYGFAKRDNDAGLPVILLCACWNLAECHRLVIANEINTRFGIEIEHLKKDSAKKAPAASPQKTLFD